MAREVPLMPELFELLFWVKESPEGGYTARTVSESIFTEADTREELEAAVRDAVRCHFDREKDMPKTLRLRYVHEEVIPL